MGIKILDKINAEHQEVARKANFLMYIVQPIIAFTNALAYILIALLGGQDPDVPTRGAETKGGGTRLMAAKSAPTPKTGEQQTGYLAYEITPNVKLTENQTYQVIVTLPEPALISELGTVRLELFHIVKETANSMADAWFDLRDGVLYAFGFETDSFSPFVIKYTVDFYYGEFEFHLNGEGSMTLSALFAALEIDRSAADAVNVVFSNPDLLSVVPTDDGADWTLTSLQPFNTAETLTVDFRNGDQIVVRVEDAIGDDGNGYLRVNDTVKGHLEILGNSYTEMPAATALYGGTDSNKYRIYAVPAPNNFFVKWTLEHNGSNDPWDSSA